MAVVPLCIRGTVWGNLRCLENHQTKRQKIVAPVETQGGNNKFFELLREKGLIEGSSTRLLRRVGLLYVDEVVMEHGVNHWTFQPSKINHRP